MVIINDLFIADFESNVTVAYKSIQNIEKNSDTIILQHQNLATILEFESSDDSQQFYKALEDKIRP